MVTTINMRLLNFDISYTVAAIVIHLSADAITYATEIS